MSVEITFYPKQSRKLELKRLLAELGFRRTGNIGAWPAGSLHFHWFCEDDYASYDGVEATIYKPDAETIEHFGCHDWAMHTRTRVWCSPADRRHQNDVIRLARSRFGGDFYNDSVGKNRYAVIDDDGRNAPSRGIYLAYEHIVREVESVKHALPEPNRSLEELVGTRLEPLSSADPVRVLYNALVPFALAALESFFGTCFKVLVRYDETAQKRVREHGKKVDMADLLAVRDGLMTVEDVVAKGYSFQNIASMHKAFREWLSIELRTVLHKRRKVARRLPLLDNQLQRLIDMRHGVIHRFEIDKGLRREDLLELLDTVTAVIDTFVDYLQADKDLVIRDQGH